MSVPMRRRELAALFAAAAISPTQLGPAPAAALSENVTLLSNRDAYSFHSGIWGYRAPSGTELAIIGTYNGTSFVNCTVPTAPVEVAFIAGPGSSWREIRTYGHYAYISNETGSGLAIVDLANPLAPTLVREHTAAFSTCHSLHMDEAAGLLYCNGTNLGLRLLDLAANPTNPPVKATFSNYYVHDSYSRGGLAYFAAVYDGFVSILDVSNLPAIPELSRITTPGAATHNCWLTADGDYCLTTDETGGGFLTVYDVRDPENPVYVSQYENPEEPGSSVHNVQVVGDFAYNSWYTAGLQIIDVRDRANPLRVGFYDTYVGGGLYNGAWGVYPHQPSGAIYISDMSTGLYVFRHTPGYATLQGTLTDAATSAPLGNATVSVPAAAATSNTREDGTYRLYLDGGVYQAVYQAFGYTSDTLTVALADSTVTTRDVALAALPSGSVSGTVKRLDTGAPLAGVRVGLQGTPFTAVTTSMGTYAFASVPASNYTETADLFGYGLVNAIIHVDAGQNTVQNFNLQLAIFADNLEISLGWVVGAPGDGATSGLWTRVDPNGTGAGMVQTEDDHTPDPGIRCYVTGNGPVSGGLGAADVDGGRTTLLSPALNLSSLTRPLLRYFRWYSNDAGPNPGEDVFRVDVSNDAGASWVNLETLGVTRNFWEEKLFDLAAVLPITSTMKLRFVAEDAFGASIVEAAIDDIEIYENPATAAVPGDPAPRPLPLALAGAPNPFRSGTTLSFRTAAYAPVLLDIFDVHGRRVARLVDEFRESGDHAVRWDGRDDAGHPVGPGMYLARLCLPGQVRTEKLVIER